MMGTVDVGFKASATGDGAGERRHPSLILIFPFCYDVCLSCLSFHAMIIRGER